MKKKSVMLLVLFSMVFGTVSGIYYNNVYIFEEKSEKVLKTVSSNRVQGNNIIQVKEDSEKVIDLLIDKVPDSHFDKLEDLSPKELSVQLNKLDKKEYEQGDKLSKEDQELILYIHKYCEQSKNANENIQQVGWCTNSAHIKNSKKKYGITASYDGYLKSYHGLTSGWFAGSNISCKVSKKVKKANFKVHHTIYGAVGSTAPYVGCIYRGTISSGNYKDNFKMDTKKDYSAFLPLYDVTYGEMNVKTSKGEFTLNTHHYKYFE